jgi:hypothetical protein
MNVREPRTIRLVEERWTTVRHIVEALAIVAAGAWAFYTFFYQEKIKPASEPPALSPSITITRLGRDAQREILNVSVSYHNVGKTELDIAADTVNVWGIRYRPRDEAQVDRRRYSQSYVVSMPEASHRLILSATEFRDGAQNGKRGWHNVVEPDATTTVSTVIAIRRGQYDLIHAQIVAVPVKLDQASVRISATEEKGGGTFLRPDPARAFESDNATDFALVP